MTNYVRRCGERRFATTPMCPPFGGAVGQLADVHSWQQRAAVCPPDPLHAAYPRCARGRPTEPL